MVQFLECQCARELAILGFLLAPEFFPGSGEVLETLPFPLDTSIMSFFLEFVIIIIVFILRMKGLSLQVVTCLQS